MTTATQRLAIIIDAKTGGAVSEIDKASKAMEGAAVTTDRATLASAKHTKALAEESLAIAKQAVETAKATGNIAALAVAKQNLTIKTQANKDATLAADKAQKTLNVTLLESKAVSAGLGDSISKLSTSLMKIGPAIAAIAVGKMLFDGVKAFGDLALQVQKFAAVSGGTTQQASLLVGQMRALGVEPEVAMKAFQRFGASIGDGTSKLNSYGIVTVKNTDGTNNLIATFENLRMAYQHTGDAATRDAIAKQLSLRAGTAMVPLLQATAVQMAAINRETARRGGVLSSADVQKAIQLKIATNEMGLAFKGMEISLAKGIIPALVEAAHHITGIVDKITSFQSFMQNKKEHPSAAGKLPGLDWDPFGVFGKKGSKDKDAATSKAFAEKSIIEVDQETKAVDHLQQSLRGEIDAEKAVRDSKKAAADATISLTTATDEYDKLVRHGAVDQKAVAAANKELEASTLGVTHALEAEEKAQDRLSKARQAATAIDLAAMAAKVALASDEIAVRQEGAQSAQEHLDKILGSGAASPTEIASARAKVKHAVDEVAAATAHLGKTQEEQQKLQQKGTDQDPAVVVALEGVQTAHDNVGVAVERQKDSEEKLRDAQKGDLDFDDKLAKAKQKIADAHTAIADAQDREMATALSLATATDALNKAIGGSGAALDVVGNKITALIGLGVPFDTLAISLSKLYPNGIANESTPNGARGDSGPGSFTPNVIGSPSPATAGIGRASGGPVSANGTYLVGENGPEMLHMGASGGSITPNGAGGTTKVIQNFYNYDQAAIAKAAAHEAAWSLATMPPPQLRMGG
ncbi:MAG: hypothetical protein NVSMB4_00520 [Acidimicrobiales bacterium]